MLNCQWAAQLTRFDCRRLTGVAGEPALEIGTPFSLHDGAAINLYIVEEGNHILISDNGDTLLHLGGAGLDVWHTSRQKSIRDAALPFGLTLGIKGDFRALARPEQAAFVFARAVSGILAVSQWAADAMKAVPAEVDIVSEAEPYIIARDPSAELRRRFPVRGASDTEYKFDLLHGRDLIDVIAPYAQATGGVMRKVGDVINGPFADQYSPLIIVDDRAAPTKASQEIAIIASLTRAMPFTRLAGGGGPLFH